MTARFAFARVRLCVGLLFALVAAVPLAAFAAEPADLGPNVGIYMLHWQDARGIPPVGSLPGSLSHYGTLDQYFESVRDLETRMVRLEDYAKLPKPKPGEPPVKDPGPGENTARFGVMLDVARLALQTDLTRIVTLYFVETSKTPSEPKASFSHHELSHHGKDAGKIEKLATLERDVLTEWGRFVGGLKEAPDGAGRLLDRTISVVGAGMGNASSHDSTNLPILVAGGRFKHGSHLAHDPKSPPPVCNLWVQVLHELGVEVPKFGSSTSETLTGFGV